MNSCELLITYNIQSSKYILACFYGLYRSANWRDSELNIKFPENIFRFELGRGISRHFPSNNSVIFNTVAVFFYERLSTDLCISLFKSFVLNGCIQTRQRCGTVCHSLYIDLCAISRTWKRSVRLNNTDKIAIKNINDIWPFWTIVDIVFYFDSQYFGNENHLAVQFLYIQTFLALSSCFILSRT